MLLAIEAAGETGTQVVARGLNHLSSARLLATQNLFLDQDIDCFLDTERAD